MNYWYLVAGSLVFLGFALFFYLSTRKKYRDPTAAPNYEKIRDKLTTRKLKVEPVESEGTGIFAILQSFIISIIVVGVTLVIGIYILGQLQSQFTAGSAALNASLPVMRALASSDGINWIPILTTVAIVTIAMTFLARAFSNNIDAEI